MSWFSAAFTRAKGALETAVSFVPIVGGAAANMIEGIHTGDEHQDAYGNWVNNSTGAATVGPVGASAQQEIDRVNRFNAEEIERLRQVAADTAARIGYGATTAAAAAIGPPGNIYQTAMNSPLVLIGGALAIGLLIFFVASGHRK